MFDDFQVLGSMFPRFFRRRPPPNSYIGLVETPGGNVHLVRGDHVKDMTEALYQEFCKVLYVRPPGKNLFADIPGDIAAVLDHKRADIEDTAGVNSPTMAVFLAASEELTRQIEQRLPQEARKLVFAGWFVVKAVQFCHWFHPWIPSDHLRAADEIQSDVDRIRLYAKPFKLPPFDPY